MVPGFKNQKIRWRWLWQIKVLSNRLGTEYCSGHLIGCGPGGDPHNSPTCTSSEHIPHKTKKSCFILTIQQLLTIPTNRNFEEIDYFETVFLLK